MLNGGTFTRTFAQLLFDLKTMQVLDSTDHIEYLGDYTKPEKEIRFVLRNNSTILNRKVIIGSIMDTFSSDFDVTWVNHGQEDYNPDVKGSFYNIDFKFVPKK